MDASVLLDLLQVGEDSCAQFVQLLNQKLQDHNFKEALKALSPAVSSQGQQAGAAVAYILQCLLYCQQHVGDLSAGLKHLLLELIPTEAARTAGQQARDTAVQLFSAYCTPADAKLAAKVAAIFQLTREDLRDWQQLTAAVQEMLTSQSSYKAAVHLLMQFEGLDEAIDKAEVITQLVVDGQDNLAQQWVTTLGRDYQILFVEACVAQDRLKPAARAVRQLGLTAEFPNIESLYRQRSLARLVGKRLWQVALSFVGSDVALQTQLVRDMAEMGEIALAHEYRKQLNLSESVLTIDPAAVAAQQEARRQQYMQLELPPGALLFVDDEAQLLQAAQLLAGSDVVGLDVEWKPSHTAGEASPAAVLQLATRNSALLFDLLKLAPQHTAALDTCLAPLFESSEVLKLGFELTGDLAKLAGSWPEVQAFRVVAGVLDLRPLWVAYGVAKKQKGGSVRLLSDVGLSTLCSTLLGKPLDKSQQMSDWTVRPLSQQQMHYAALDAYVLPQLFDKLCSELGEQRSQQLLKQHTTSVRRQQQVPPPASAVATTAAASSVDGAALGSVADALLKEAAGLANNSNSSSNSDDGGNGSAAQVAAVVGPASVGGNGSTHIGSSSSSSSVVNSSGAGDAGGSSSGEAHVMAFLQHRGFEGAFRRLTGTRPQGCVPTISDTATALSVPRAAVAKTMALLVDHEPLLVVTRGDQRVDMHKLAAQLGVKKRAVRIAPDSVVQKVTGFSSGGIPPVGHDSSIKVLVDCRLQEAAAAATAAAAVTASGVVADHEAHQQQQQQQLEAVSRPAGGGWAAVAGAAAAAAVSADQQTAIYCPPTTGTTNQPCRRGEGGNHRDEAANAIHAATDSHAAARKTSNRLAEGAGSKLFLQCGSAAVISLSFEQLMQLSSGTVADVADVPTASPAAAASSAAKRAAASEQQQQQQAAGFGQLAASGVQMTVPRFLVDSMLGRLCRWLRALGVDAEFVETGGKQQLQQQARVEGQPLLLQNLGQQQQGQLIEAIHKAALTEGRLFLTRDTKLAARRDVGGSVYLLSTDDAAEQLTEISRHFGIHFDESTAMSRCSVCNAAAFQQISREAATALVPPRVMQVVDEFWQCGNCGKVFWMGPKSQAAIDLLSSLFKNGKTVPTPLQSWRQLDPADA